MATGALELDRLRIAKAGKVLVSLNWTIRPGEVLTIMGPSGSGKSTTLAAVLGTLPPSFEMTGRILLNGRGLDMLPPHLRRVGLLFQDDVLFPHLSVAENLAFALPPELRGRAQRKAAVEEALAQAGLPGFGSRDPGTLSGGQRARVALMRALLAQPDALLLDEPFSRLDAQLRGQIRDFVLETIRTRSIPAILVTHDAEDARAAAGAVLSPRGEVLTP